MAAPSWFSAWARGQSVPPGPAWGLSSGPASTWPPAVCAPAAPQGLGLCLLRSRSLAAHFLRGDRDPREVSPRGDRQRRLQSRSQLPVGSGSGLGVGSPAGEEGSVQVQRGHLALPGGMEAGCEDSQPLTGPGKEQAGEGSQDGAAPRGGCRAVTPALRGPRPELQE